MEKHSGDTYTYTSEINWFKELPVKEDITDITLHNDKIWVETHTGKKFVIPASGEGEFVRADLRLV